MLFAKRVFFVAGVYGLVVLTPFYFLETKVGEISNQPVTHPEYYYGFLGVALALSWPAGLLVAATWLAAAAIWRISSLSALIAAALAPLYMLYLGGPVNGFLIALLALLIFMTHRQNIARLGRGEEPRIGGAKPPST